MEFTWRGIPGFAFKGSVQMLVRGTYQPGSMQKLATRIFDFYLKGKKFDDALQTYVDLCCTIDKVKTATIGLNASTVRSNALMQGIATIFAREIAMTDKQIDKISELANSLKSITGKETWFFPKLETVYLNAEKVRHMHQFAESIIAPPIAAGLIQDFAPEAGRQAREIVHELLTLRKYGVKSSFFQDGILHHPSDAWVFMDFDELKTIVPTHRQFMNSSPLAFIGLSDKKSLKKIGFEPEVVSVGEGLLRGAKLTFAASGAMTIDEEGELDASFGLGLLPLRAFFVQHDNEAGYEFLRFAQALRLYDLVVPLTTVAKMPQPENPKGLIGRVQQIFGRKNPLNLDLLIPRLRTLENTDLLIRDLEIEIEQADEETVKRTSREMRRHEVVWHIRRLPYGKHPTPESKERAAEYGIALDETETFVKPHERGKGPLEKIMHHAKGRMT